MLQEQREAFGSRSEKGQGGLAKRPEWWGRGGAVSFVSRGWLVWISYLAILDGIQPLGRGLLSLVKLFHCMTTPSEIAAVRSCGRGSPSLLF